MILEDIFRSKSLEELAGKAQAKAKAAAAVVREKFDEKEQYIPAVFEKGNTSRIIPAVEAFFNK